MDQAIYYIIYYFLISFFSQYIVKTTIASMFKNIFNKRFKELQKLGFFPKKVSNQNIDYLINKHFKMVRLLTFIPVLNCILPLFIRIFIQNYQKEFAFMHKSELDYLLNYNNQNNSKENLIDSLSLKEDKCEEIENEKYFVRFGTNKNYSTIDFTIDQNYNIILLSALGPVKNYRAEVQIIAVKKIIAELKKGNFADFGFSQNLAFILTDFPIENTSLNIDNLSDFKRIKK